MRVWRNLVNHSYRTWENRTAVIEPNSLKPSYATNTLHFFNCITLAFTRINLVTLKMEAVHCLKTSEHLINIRHSNLQDEHYLNNLHEYLNIKIIWLWAHKLLLSCPLSNGVNRDMQHILKMQQISFLPKHIKWISRCVGVCQSRPFKGFCTRNQVLFLPNLFKFYSCYLNPISTIMLKLWTWSC